MGLGLCAESKAPKMCFSLAPKSKYKNIILILNYVIAIGSDSTPSPCN